MTSTNPQTLKTFFEAIEGGNVQSTIEMLKLKGVDIESRNKDDSNQTALQVAAKYGHVELVKILVDDFKADINTKDIHGCTPMKIAVDNGQVDVAKILEKKKPKDFEYAKRILNEEIIDDIFEAADTNNIAKVVELLDSKKVKINVSDKSKYNRSLLNAAAANGDLELVKLLVEKYDADMNWSDEIGESSIHMAADRGHYKVTKYLADNGSRHVEDVAEFLEEGKEEES